MTAHRFSKQPSMPSSFSEATVVEIEKLPLHTSTDKMAQVECIMELTKDMSKTPPQNDFVKVDMANTTSAGPSSSSSYSIAHEGFSKRVPVDFFYEMEANTVNEDVGSFQLSRKLLRRRHVRKEQMQRRRQLEQSKREEQIKLERKKRRRAHEEKWLCEKSSFTATSSHSNLIPVSEMSTTAATTTTTPLMTPSVRINIPKSTNMYTTPKTMSRNPLRVPRFSPLRRSKYQRKGYTTYVFS